MAKQPKPKSKSGSKSKAGSESKSSSGSKSSSDSKSKPKSKPKTIDAYIKDCPRTARRVLKTVRTTFRKAAPDAEETIKYGMPTFTLKGNLVFFSAWKEHVGVYGLPSAHKSFKAKTAAYAGPKGSLTFRYNEPIPLDLLGDLVAARRMKLLGTLAKKKVARPTPRKKAR